MDWRSASFSLPPGMAAPGSTSQPDFHLSLGPSSILAPPRLNPRFTFQASSIGVLNSAVGAGVVEPVTKKRGRPRKYRIDEPVSVSASSTSILPSDSRVASALEGSSAPKRRRAGHLGTGRMQMMSACGGWLAGTAGIGFSPHAIRIEVGEDITSRIMSFSLKGPRDVCILSAVGVVSTVTLRQTATSGGPRIYEGRFEILTLSGSYLWMIDDHGSEHRTGGLTVSLSTNYGDVFSGVVDGRIIAASPIQLIVGSFIGRKPKKKTKKNKKVAVSDRAEGNERGTQHEHGTLFDQAKGEKHGTQQADGNEHDTQQAEGDEYGTLLEHEEENEHGTPSEQADGDEHFSSSKKEDSDEHGATFKRAEGDKLSSSSEQEVQHEFIIQARYGR